MTHYDNNPGLQAGVICVMPLSALAKLLLTRCDIHDDAIEKKLHHQLA